MPGSLGATLCVGCCVRWFDKLTMNVPGIHPEPVEGRLWALTT